jgi:hypothetical protein
MLSGLDGWCGALGVDRWWRGPGRVGGPPARVGMVPRGRAVRVLQGASGTPAVADVCALLVACLGRVVSPEDLLQVGGPLNDQSAGLVAGVGCFRLGITSPRYAITMI